MNQVALYTAAQLSAVHAVIDRWLREQSTPERERGSHTTEQIMWVVAILGIVAIATLAVTTFVTAQAAKLK